MTPFCLLVSFLIAAPLPKDDDKDLKELQGVWKVVEWSRDGEVFKQEERYFFVIKDDDLAKYVTNGIDTPHFRIEAKGGKYNEVRLGDPANPGVGKDHPGIYSLKGDTLKICRISAAKGTARANFEPPTKFETYKDSNHVYYLLERSSFEAMKGLPLMRSDPVKGLVRYRFGEEDKKPKDDD